MCIFKYLSTQLLVLETVDRWQKLFLFGFPPTLAEKREKQTQREIGNHVQSRAEKVSHSYHKTAAVEQQQQQQKEAKSLPGEKKKKTKIPAPFASFY
jgi:hypothetical protein